MSELVAMIIGGPEAYEAVKGYKSAKRGGRAGTYLADAVMGNGADGSTATAQAAANPDESLVGAAPISPPLAGAPALTMRPPQPFEPGGKFGDHPAAGPMQRIQQMGGGQPDPANAAMLRTLYG